MVLSDAVARANQEPFQVAYDEMRPHLDPFLDRGLETADPIVTPDGTVRMQVLTPAADAGDCLGIARTEQAVTFSLNHGQLVIRPGGSLTRQLREKGLDASDEDSLWGLSPDLATDPDVREMTDAEAAAWPAPRKSWPREGRRNQLNGVIPRLTLKPPPRPSGRGGGRLCRPRRQADRAVGDVLVRPRARVLAPLGQDDAAVLAPPGVVPLKSPRARAPQRQGQHPAQHLPASPTPRAHLRTPTISIRLRRHAHGP